MSDLFTQFWAAYPRKVSKAAAERAFLKLKPDAALLEKLLSALAWQRTQPQWQDVQYVPHASTWLNGRRFEDEPFQPCSEIRRMITPSDWFTECSRLHDLSCGNRTAHAVVMARGAV